MTEQEQKEFDELKDSLRDAESEIEDLQGQIEHLENQEPEIQEVEPEFSAMVDQDKYHLFMDSFGFFSLEQFEAFVKTTKYPGL